MDSRHALQSIKDARLSFAGRVGELITAITANWLLPLPLANPDMIEMFRNRNRRPLRRLLFHSGEYAGKYLTGAVQVYRLNRDRRLETHIAWFVNELLAAQAKNGYLGPWPEDCMLTGSAPNCEDNGGIPWDAWGHYHIMLGLLYWYDQSGDEHALQGAIGIADLLCDVFLAGDRRMVALRSTEMNLAPIHSLCLLYQVTGSDRYLKLALEIEQDFADPSAGDYVRTALEGVEFHDTPLPRWESLHPVQGISELYFATGEPRYRRAFEHIWWSVVKTDRHNNGGFSSGEAATGSPYCTRPIETCCTIAWMALSVDMLRMTGDSRVADELELSFLNSGIGLVSPSGRWFTYNTPMEGLRKSFSEDTLEHFHGRPGTSELSCCAANGPRSIGILSDWCVMARDDGLVLNYFGECRMEAELPSGNSVRIEQKTRYPLSGEVLLVISPVRPERFVVQLRIPYWSERSAAEVNSEAVHGVQPGRYAAIDRRWEDGDEIRLSLDLSLHYWAGEEEFEGRSSIYRGPLLMALDTAYDDSSSEALPAFDALAIEERPASVECWFKPWLLREFSTVDGRWTRLCDFGSAGFLGYPYRTWLDVRNVTRAGFSRSNPLRSWRPGQALRSLSAGPNIARTCTKT